MSRAATASVVVVLGLALLGFLVGPDRSGPGSSGGPVTSQSSSTSATPVTPSERSASKGGPAAGLERWEERAAAAFAPLGEVLPDLLRTADDWRGGEVGDEQLRSALDRVAPVIEAVSTDVEALDPLGEEPLAQPLLAASADLYVQMIEVQRAAVSIEPSPLRAQTDLLARRLRVLADRTFDRARALVEAQDPPVTDPDIVLSLPAEVPSWPAELLAPGPPLSDAPPVPAELYPQREADRPVQPESRWRDAVAAAGAPTAEAVAGALTIAPAAELGVMADALEAIVESLGAVADPAGAGGRERHTRLRLGLLVRAEAVRAAQLDGLLDGAAGDRLARTAGLLAALSSRPAFDDAAAAG